MTARVDVIPQADDILARWLRGQITYVHAVRSLVALGLTADEADCALAGAKESA